MTDIADQAESAAAVPPAPPIDAFAVVASLLALIADERGCQARLTELKAQIDAAEKASRRLEHQREGHERALRRDRGEIETERKSLADRQRRVEEAEHRLERQIAGFQYSNGGPDPRHLEPDDRPRSGSDDEVVMVTERVPGPPGSSLARTIPRPKRTMRRVQPEHPDAA